jgi:hypothetical protein
VPGFRWDLGIAFPVELLESLLESLTPGGRMRIARGDRLRQRMVRKATHGRFLSGAVGIAGTNCSATRAKLRLSRKTGNSRNSLLRSGRPGFQLTVFRLTRSFRRCGPGIAHRKIPGKPCSLRELDARWVEREVLVDGFPPETVPGHSPRAKRREMGTCRPEGYPGSGGFCGTLFGALKGASGPREGQKSTFCNRQSDSAN